MDYSLVLEAIGLANALAMVLILVVMDYSLVPISLDCEPFPSIES